MAAHPSLASQFNPPPPRLYPLFKMEPNERCWCRSGKKWKKCHKDRYRQVPDHIGARVHAMKLEMTKEKYCLHPEAGLATCGARIIRAHTIQRKGGLAEITENGHVISVKVGFEDISKNDGEIVPRELSARDASTFMGFCDRHDNEMFKSVETGAPVLDKESIFLFSFRAIAYEVFMKDFALRCIPIQRETDKGKPFTFQCDMQEQINVYEYGLKLGVKDGLRWKSDYDSAFIQKNYDSFRFYGIAFSEILPIVGCGAFHPEFDFNGSPLQSLGQGSVLLEHMTFNLTVLNGLTVVVFGWFQETNGPSDQFVRSYKSLRPSVKADAAVRLAFEHIENIYLKPSWWHGLPEATRLDAIQRMKSGTVDERHASCLRDADVEYVSAEIVQEIEDSLTSKWGS